MTAHQWIERVRREARRDASERRRLGPDSRARGRGGALLRANGRTRCVLAGGLGGTPAQRGAHGGGADRFGADACRASRPSACLGPSVGAGVSSSPIRRAMSATIVQSTPLIDAKSAAQSGRGAEASVPASTTSGCRRPLAPPLQQPRPAPVSDASTWVERSRIRWAVSRGSPRSGLRTCAPVRDWRPPARRPAAADGLLRNPRSRRVLGLEVVAALADVVVGRPVDVLVELRHQRDVLRAVDVGLFDVDDHPLLGRLGTLGKLE